MGGGHDKRLDMLNDARWKHGPCGEDMLIVTMILNTVTPDQAEPEQRSQAVGEDLFRNGTSNCRCN